jgi:hypothetical protein
MIELESLRRVFLLDNNESPASQRLPPKAWNRGMGAGTTLSARIEDGGKPELPTATNGSSGFRQQACAS